MTRAAVCVADPVTPRVRPDLLDGRALVEGRWISGETTIPVEDPATGAIVGEVAALAPADVDRAIAAAEAAFPAWRRRLPVERGRILRAWGELMRRDAEQLAVLMTVEQGKPLAEARGEIDYAAGFLDWFAAEGERAYGETMPSHRPNSLVHVRMQPVGVAAAVTP